MVIESVGLVDVAGVVGVESVAVTWKLLVPGDVGVPEITPVEPLRDRPPGRAPLVTAQLIGELPPVLASVWLYEVPTKPLGSDVVVTESADATVMESGDVPVFDPESVTLYVWVQVPLVVSVPLSTPPDESDNPPQAEPPAELME